MEIRARYVLIGAVRAGRDRGRLRLRLLAATTPAGCGERAVYRVRFESSVSGLLDRVGGAVQRHPRRRGHVRSSSSRDEPRQVHRDDRRRAGHAGPRGHACRARLPGPDRRRRRSRSTGGTPTGRCRGRAASRRVLVADAARRPEHDAGRARRAAPRRRASWPRMPSRCASTIANLNTFSAALARNSDRLDGIVAGLERMTGGAAAKARTARLRPCAAAYPQGRTESIGARSSSCPIRLGARGPRQRQDPERHAGRRRARRCPMRNGATRCLKLVQVKIIRAFEDAGAICRRQPAAGRRHGRRPAPHRRAQVPALAWLPANRRDRALGQGPRRQGQDRQYAHLPRVRSCEGERRGFRQSRP